jgi:replicative DNA helicase
MDKRAIFLLLGCLCKQPELLLEARYGGLSTKDFPESYQKIIFGSIKNLAMQGNKELTPFSIDSFLKEDFPIQYKKFTQNNGIEYLESAIEQSIINNFEYYYKRIKKFSCLQDYIDVGVDVSDIYDPDSINGDSDISMLNTFDNMSISDIMNKIDSRILTVKNKYNLEMGKHGQQAGKGLHILKEQLN